MNIYVANIPWKASEEQLKQLFAEYGEVSSAKIIMDKVTQRSRGFGFIEITSTEASASAIATTTTTATFFARACFVNDKVFSHEISSV